MTINFANQFAIMGKLWFAADTDNTFAAGLMENEWEDAMQGFGSESAEIEQARNAIFSALRAVQATFAAAHARSVRSVVETIFIEAAYADNAIGSKTVDAAIAEWIKQLYATSGDLDGSAITLTPSYPGPDDGGSNAGNGVLVTSTKRGDGLVNVFSFAEDIEMVCTSTLTGGSAVFEAIGEEKVDDLAYNWPAGSGIDMSINSNTGASDNLLGTGGFETSDANNTNVPAGWAVSVGTLGTTFKVTPVEVQTVIVSGSPTSGHYTLTSQGETTDPIAWNATSASVQSALQALVGHGSVTIVETGTTPNFTHTVTMTGLKNPSQITSVSNLNTGSIAHALAVASSTNTLRGARCLDWDGNGSSLDAIQYRVSLDATTQYAFNIWVSRDVDPAAGAMVVDLVDGIGGSVIADDQSVSNTFTIDLTNLTTSLVAYSGVFRTPTALPESTWLRIRLTTAISSGTSVFTDEAVLVEMSEMYTGGPSASMFSGSSDWKVSDTAKIVVTNDRAGAVHEWLDRSLGLRGKDILFPIDTSGGESIADSVIA